MIELLGIARFKFREGKLDEFKRLSAQAMEIVRTKDAGTLQYDTYFNDDRRFVRALALKGEGAAAIRLLSSAEVGFEELEGQVTEGWIDRMNDATREIRALRSARRRRYAKPWRAGS